MTGEISSVGGSPQAQSAKPYITGIIIKPQSMFSGHSYRLRIPGLDATLSIRLSKDGTPVTNTLTDLGKKFVKLEIISPQNTNLTEVFVKVSNLAKHLKLTEEEINKAVKEGKLPQLIDAQKQINRAISLIANEISMRTGDERHGALEAEKLRTEIEVAHRSLAQSDTHTIASANSKHKYVFIRSDKAQSSGVVAMKMFTPTDSVIGYGSYNTVFEVNLRSLTSSQGDLDAAHVVAEPSGMEGKPLEEVKKRQEESKAQMESAIKILKKLHVDEQGNKKIIEGIQHPPFAVVTIDGKKGYLMPYYGKGDLRVHAKDLNEASGFANTQRLLGGFSHILSQNSFYNDIKPDNILVNNQRECDLADFGGVVTFDEMLQDATYHEKTDTISSNHLPDTSPGWLMMKDKVKREVLFIQCVKAKDQYEKALTLKGPDDPEVKQLLKRYEEKKEEHETYAKKNMIFSMGLSLSFMAVPELQENFARETDDESLIKLVKDISKAINRLCDELQRQPNPQNEERLKYYALIYNMIRQESASRISPEDLNKTLAGLQNVPSM